MSWALRHNNDKVRGLLAEFGAVVPCGAQNVTRQAAVAAEGLPVPLQRAVLDLLSHLRLLQERICEYEHRLQELAKGNKIIQHLQSIPGVGALSASAVVGSIGDPGLFRNGRQFAAWLGLVPRRASTGGKTRLGSITKKGDAYLGTLLILGARTVIRAGCTQNGSLEPLAVFARAAPGLAKSSRRPGCEERSNHLGAYDLGQTL